MENARKNLTGTDMPLGHFPVLAIIRLNPEATQSAIAKAVGLQRSSLVPILKKLEQNGWIKRTGDMEDRRANRLTLTPEGERACESLMPEVDNVEAMTRAKLGNRKYERLVELLRDLHQLLGE
ncbi:MarR family transcriptional regulator [Paracoccus sp. SSK6]|uniref:MarR family winged helix-turn-helix transcriptional regulator n=1 Tax=Paracoccus sp. SSK6 TaxID=3143131 RepID=UPI00321AFD4F